jgi:hypothetical protein
MTTFRKVWALAGALGAGTWGSSLAAEPPDAGVAPASYLAAAGENAGQFDRVTLVRQLMRRRGGDPAAAAQLIQLTRELDAATVAALFDELAAAHLAAGQVNLAADVRLQLAQTYPDEPRAQDAVLWLTRLYASSEVAHFHRAKGDAPPPDDADQGLAMYALNLANQCKTPSSEQKPNAALAFTQSIAARRAGLGKSATGLLTSLKHARAVDGWGDCARTEAWLAESRGEAAPKATARCVAAAEPPRLDGVLDEPFWQGDASVAIGPAGAGSAMVRLAFDAEHLYVGVECPKLEGVDYTASDGPRPYDRDLSRHDRVRLVLDADRDYATAFELTVDSRGWTNDRCWEESRWNPEWYVAAGANNASAGGPWIVEAAIPWRELAIRAPGAGEAWACAVEREAPDAPRQSWLGDASQARGPEHFGLLLFE